MIRPVVYDTMIFVQAAVRPDRIHRTFRLVADGLVTLCLSRQLVAEIEDVLTRAEVQAKFPALTPESIAPFLADIAATAKHFDPIPNLFSWPEHPDDDHLFNLAIEARAEFLVTWEKRILKLAVANTGGAIALRRLTPQLKIITPPELAGELNPRG